MSWRVLDDRYGERFKTCKFASRRASGPREIGPFSRSRRTDPRRARTPAVLHGDELVQAAARLAVHHHGAARGAEAEQGGEEGRASETPSEIGTEKNMKFNGKVR